MMKCLKAKVLCTSVMFGFNKQNSGEDFKLHIRAINIFLPLNDDHVVFTNQGRSCSESVQFFWKSAKFILFGNVYYNNTM